MTQQPISRVVSQHLTMHCLDQDGSARPIEASFGYDPLDPYAVWITFHSGAGDVRWAVCRSLIAHGLTEPVGDGDVQLWPSIDAADGRAIVMCEFNSPEGELVAHARTAEIHRFLVRTLDVVPFGSESLHLDVDSLILGLMGSGA